MINLLIDTCSLINLRDGDNEELSLLETFISSKKIIFYTHEHIISEWEKNKVKRINKIERRLKYIHENAITNDLLPSESSVSIKEKTERIDNIIYTATKVNTPQGITDELIYRFRNRLAPFHNKKDSLNDWEIIGSFCIYCQNLNIDTVYFISNNHTDFASSEDPERIIHPTIQERFNSLNIKYYKNYTDLFNQLLYLTLPANSITIYRYYNENYAYESSIKKSILESVNYLYDYLYNDLSFIPIHILKKFYPFAVSDQEKSYFSNFTLNRVHQDFIDFCNTFEIDHSSKILIKNKSQYGNDADLYKSLVIKILKRLSHNLIYNVRDSSERNKINIFYYDYEQTSCDCCRCTFNDLQYNKTFKSLQQKVHSIEDKIKFAFINYQVGNFSVSCRLFLEVAKEAILVKRHILYFIATYNLKNLVFLLNNYFYNDVVDDSLIEYLKKIDIQEEAVKLKHLTDYNLLNFIAQEDYFNHTFQEIKITVDKIISHYYSQIKGGWSSNSHIFDLIQKFTEFERFINSNFIICDKYLNFDYLFDLVVEGILASHAIKESQGARFAKFDDYWIHKFVVYGKKENIIKYFVRYKLKHMNYEPYDKVDNYFMRLVNNYFLDELVIDDTLVMVQNFGNKFFKSNYDNLFDTIITMAALMNLNIENINSIVAMLLSYLKRRDKLSYEHEKTILTFLNRKGSKINELLLIDYIDFIIYTEKEYSMFPVLETVIDVLPAKVFNKIACNTFNVLLSKILDQYQKSLNGYIEILISIYAKSNKKRKRIISDIVNSMLKEKFEFELYYNAVILDIVEFDEVQFLAIIKEHKFEKVDHSFRSFFGSDTTYHNDKIDKFINIIFKYNVHLSKDLTRRIGAVSIYYKWLMNMDKFNYEKFDPEWIFHYWTLYYLNNMAKSKKLISTLIDYCKHNKNSRIENALLKITYKEQFKR